MADDPHNSSEDERSTPSDPKAETSHAQLGADGIDPELVRLPKKAMRVRPILALAIIGICLTLGARLWSDWNFSRQGDSPKQIDSVDALNDSLVDKYVEVEVVADFQQSLRIMPSTSSTGPVLLPILGTESRAWLLVPPTPWTGELTDDAVYKGRVQSFESMDFSDELRAHLKSGLAIPRPVSLEAVREALESKASKITSVFGDQYPITPDTAIRYTELAFDRVKLTTVRSDSYQDEQTWRFALEQQGFTEINLADSTPNSWTFEASYPGGLVAAQKKLRTNRIFAAKVVEIRSERQGKWSDLALDGKDIYLGELHKGMQAHTIALEVRAELPSNAVLLNTSDQPSDYWYVSIILLGLGIVILIFGYGFVREMRGV